MSLIALEANAGRDPGRDEILFSYRAWREDKNRKARDWLRLYCEYIASTATRAALLELDCLFSLY